MHLYLGRAIVLASTLSLEVKEDGHIPDFPYSRDCWLLAREDIRVKGQTLSFACPESSLPALSLARLTNPAFDLLTLLTSTKVCCTHLHIIHHRIAKSKISLLLYTSFHHIDVTIFSTLRMDNQVLFLPVPHVPSPNPFLSLAPEVKQMIFSALPNASSLKPLVLTCSSFYHTFLDAEPLIIKSILQNQIGPDLMCDAIVVFKSRTMKTLDHNAAIALLGLYATRDFTCLSQTWKLRDALAIGGLHDNIESFSRGFASSALSTNPVTGLDDTSPSPLSLLESNRLKRTFYRYELFCNTFRGSGSFSFVDATPESPRRRFFTVCAPWENEQLCCVRDYLHEQLSLRKGPQNLRA